MPISLSINGNPQYTASLSGAGYLNAHVNVRNRPRENDLSADVRLDATDTSQERENVRMDWPAIPLHAGDVVELKLMPPGEGDPPVTRAGHPRIRGTCLPARRTPPNWSAWFASLKAGSWIWPHAVSRPSHRRNLPNFSGPWVLWFGNWGRLFSFRCTGAISIWSRTN